jgi:hypothetical protein
MGCKRKTPRTDGVASLANRCATPVRTMLGWVGLVSVYELSYSWEGKDKSEDLKRTEAGSSTLANGLNCYWGVLVISPAVVYSSWGTMSVLAGEGDIDLLEGIWNHHALAYSNSFEVLLTLHFEWTDLIPS